MRGLILRVHFRICRVAILFVGCALWLSGTSAAATVELRAEDGRSSQPAQSLSEARVVQRAIDLLTLEPGIEVVLIDPELVPDPESIRRLDVFVVNEPDGSVRRVIYVNRESDIVRQAADGSELHVGVLAAVIHHEAQHLAGASEQKARQAELVFFHALIASGRIPSDAGHRYLQQLDQRADAETSVASY
jgi:hypothetical protein